MIGLLVGLELDLGFGMSWFALVWVSGRFRVELG